MRHCDPFGKARCAARCHCTRTPRVPDAGCSHIFMSDSRVDLTLSDPDNETIGALSADYESGTDIFALSLSLKV